jgi:hypothetical protein
MECPSLSEVSKFDQIAAAKKRMQVMVMALASAPQ